MRWDGRARWSGGIIREQVAALARAARAAAETAAEGAGDIAEVPAQADDGAGFDEAGVIEWACTKSSFFNGLLTLLDSEVLLAVEPFILWEQGDIRPFLRALPSMCALIASGSKVKVIGACYVRKPCSP